MLTQYHQEPTSTALYCPSTSLCFINKKICPNNQMSTWDKHSCTLVQFRCLNAVSNDDSILDLIVMYLLRFQTVTRQSPGVGCWKLSLTITLKRCSVLSVFELPYYRERDSCSHSSTLLQATCPWQTWPRTALPTLERVLRKPLQIWTSPSSWIRCRLCL